MNTRSPTIATLRKLAAEPGSNLAVLPTAPNRMVKQGNHVADYYAAKMYRERNPWPGSDPIDRKMERAQRAYEERTTLSSALVIALAIYEALGPKQRQQAFRNVARRLQASHDEAAREAINALCYLTESD